MTEKKEMSKEEQIKSLNRQIEQTKMHKDLVEREKKYKEELYAIKAENNQLVDGTDKPAFVYMQSFYDTLLNIEKVNLDHYLINVKDSITQDDSRIEGFTKLIKDIKEKKEEVVE